MIKIGRYEVEARFEWKVQDRWIGEFDAMKINLLVEGVLSLSDFAKANMSTITREVQRDIWLILPPFGFPCFPLHLTIKKRLLPGEGVRFADVLSVRDQIIQHAKLTNSKACKENESE